MQVTEVSKNYGFVIDNRRCIGCHACSVACKSENEVPLSVNRTWVKYVETGTYPEVGRSFQVTRCNHCANPPCARICPTGAMYQRKDGIVEFDNSVCIGCQACLQACPYDAIHIDPETNTAAKCHYCAHRTDMGMEPACVVVCPEEAIISGDMNDPTSKISRLIATEKVTVRKPEQGTAPKLFYIDGDAAAMHPTATSRTPETYMFADVIPLHSIEVRTGYEDGFGNGNGHAKKASNVPIRPRNIAMTTVENWARVPQQQGLPVGGPIQTGSHGTVAGQMVQTSYNAQHKVPWHWPVPAYLVTKSIGAGMMLLFSLGSVLNIFRTDWLTETVTVFVSLLFIGLTTALLVYDLKKPMRFLYILIRPQWKSWLTRGAVVLIGISTLGGIWFLLNLFFDAGQIAPIRTAIMWLAIPFAIMAAIYTAFLFAQAEGRDLWQSPLLPFHLLIQAVMAGAAGFLVMDVFLTMDRSMIFVMRNLFVLAILTDLFITLMGEFYIPHASEVAAKAAHEISHGHYKNHFWYGSVVLGHLIPLVLVLASRNVAAGAIAGLAAVAGLYLYEYAFVMAPQEIPNS